ncbi:SusC/RagA family TonB-linked outer membrane protein [Leptobacterium flavescens]|uniref:SusC/RagA family TonB-linked outer membrane protein n=1 Tax=Leptobacterium flavescens TaxID=472055 RepID=A0A6P0USK5_9FLAO|nr:TonB-dependent receptor [Leptobacterium flavescens]NER14968.1 SusC/RagA family TonB-linked outer membrane protein [Leptobacterium flavescens]
MRLKFTWMLTLFMALVFQSSFAQQKTVTGTITDQDGLPLPGANILVKGTTRGQQSDFDGNYSIQVSVGQVLVFSYIGQLTVERTVGAANVINVQLLQDAEVLDEVVVLGYGTKSVAKVSAAVSSVSSEQIEQVPIASFEQILQGRAPGLEIRSGNGAPGSAARVRIRGSASINGNNDPLYIIDGVPVDENSFASFNPNDFENVSVLKDAQASSLYGSRAAAGVIVITTKKGRKGQKTQFSYRSQIGFSEVPEPNFEVLSARQFLELGRTIGANNLSDAEIDQQVAAAPRNLRDEVFRTGTTLSQEFSARGGSENISYFASANYFEQEGIVIGSELQRLTTRLNLDIQASERLKFGINTSLGFSRRDFLVNNAGVNLNNPVLVPFIANPLVNVRNDDGTFNTGDGLSFLAPNVVERTQTGINESEEFKLVASGYLNYKFTDFLSFNYTLGVDFEDDFDVFATNPNSEFGRDATPGNAGNQQETSRRDTRIVSTAQLKYEDTFAEKHYVTASGFVEYIKGFFRSSTFQGFGIEPELFGFANSITPGTTDNGLIPTVGGVTTENGLFSVFGTAGYEYDGKYGIDVSLRNDKSSRFAPTENSATFYSVAGRWNVDREKFLDNAEWITSLKLRASFGTSGNEQSIGDFQFLPNLGRTLFQGENVLVQGAVANEGIRWEFTEQFNVGVDFGFLNNRISGSVDYYNRETSDLIIPFNLPAAFGDNSVNANAGSLVNKGFEIAVSGDVWRSEDAVLTVFGNIAFNDNEVTDLGQVDQFEQGTSVIRVGERLGSHFVTEFAGVNPSNGEPLYRDLDGNITNVFSDAFRRTGFGSSEPEYTGGFGLNFRWKGFEVSSLFSFVGGFFRFNNVSFFTENFNFFNAGLNQDVRLLDVFQNPGDITDIPAPQFQRQFSSQDIEDASFLRFRNLTVGYNVSGKVLERLSLTGLRIYVQGVNLATWTKFRGFDPEDNNNISSFEFPNPRQFTLGLDLNF